MGEAEIYARIKQLEDKVGDTRERLVKAEVIADRAPIIEAQLTKLNDLLNKIAIKQATLNVKVALIVAAVGIAVSILVNMILA